MSIASKTAGVVLTATALCGFASLASATHADTPTHPAHRHRPRRRVSGGGDGGAVLPRVPRHQPVRQPDQADLGHRG